MRRPHRRYLDRLAASLERKAGQEARLLAAAREAAQRRREAQSQLASAAPKLAELVARTRAVKAATEKALAVMLGRRVNVLGDINSQLAGS